MKSNKYKPYVYHSDHYNAVSESFDPRHDFGGGYSYTKVSKKFLKF